MNINKFYGMTGGVIVCNWCNGDHLGACSDVSSKRGFTAYCFDCDAPCTTLELPMSDASTLEDATERSALDVWRNAAMRDTIARKYQLGSLGELI
jgi:hypothetical protein